MRPEMNGWVFLSIELMEVKEMKQHGVSAGDLYNQNPHPSGSLGFTISLTNTVA
jgi:hypothetical protein